MDPVESVFSSSSWSSPFRSRYGSQNDLVFRRNRCKECRVSCFHMRLQDLILTDCIREVREWFILFLRKPDKLGIQRVGFVSTTLGLDLLEHPPQRTSQLLILLSSVLYEMNCGTGGGRRNLQLTKNKILQHVRYIGPTFKGNISQSNLTFSFRSSKISTSQFLEIRVKFLSSSTYFRFRLHALLAFSCASQCGSRSIPYQ
jgi:hypothetical protein